MQPRILSVQILRGIAALLVVWFHARDFALSLVDHRVSKLDTIGSIGVDMFFVISGAIIYQTAFAGRRLSPSEFLRRRLTRIVPVYFLLTLAWIPFAIQAGFPVTWQAVMSTAAFMPWLGHFTLPIIQPGWTLCFEMLFYGSAALALISRRWALAVLGGFAIALMANVFGGIRQFAFIGNPMILEFLAGFLIMRCWSPRNSPGLALVLFFAAGVMLISTAPSLPFTNVEKLFTSNLGWIRPLIWGAPSALILIATLSLEPATPSKVPALPILLGDASYSIYLVHWPMMAVMRPHIFPGLATSVFLAAVTSAAGVGVHLVIERPLLRALRSCREVHRVPA